MKVLLGKKIGMTQIFEESTGEVIPVTLVDVSNNVVAKVLKNGEEVTHVEFGMDKQKKPRAVDLGNYKSLNFVPKFKSAFKTKDALEVGTELKADTFSVGDYVDVIATTKGKGFQGVIKRWGFRGEKASHGKPVQRKPGSIGSGTTLGRVFKGTKMGGHMGNARKTVKNLKVVFVSTEENLVGVKGAVPGNKKGYLVLKSAR